MNKNAPFYKIPPEYDVILPDAKTAEVQHEKLREHQENQSATGLFHTTLALSNYNFATRMLVGHFLQSIIVDGHYLRDNATDAQRFYVEVPVGMEQYIEKVIPDFVDIATRRGYKVQVSRVPYKGKLRPRTVKFVGDWTYA